MTYSIGSCLRRFVAISTLLFSICVAAKAQSTSAGGIGGAVTDPQQAAIPGATVTVHNSATNATASAKTDESGRYVITNLPPGDYDVEITAANFSTQKHANVIVEVGLVTPVDAQLGVAGQAQTVTVTGEAPVVNTERNDFSSNINGVSISNLPINGRKWSSFVLSTPGAVPDGTFGLVSFRGISGLLNNNTVDGGDNNQAFFADEKGRTRIPYSTSQQSIREFQVNNANYSAEYGRAAGGVVNAVTKSGTNQYHGGIFFYDRDNSVGAFNPFTRAAVNVNGTFVTQAIKPVDRRYQFGGDVGGYIFKDKLYWYFDFDQQKRDFPLTSIPTSPNVFFSPLSASEIATVNSRGVSAAQANAALSFLQRLTGVVPRTGDQTIYFPKIDWNLTANNKFMISANRLRWKSPEGFLTGATVSSGIDDIGSDFVKDDAVTTRLVSTISPALMNELRFIYGRDFEYEFSDPPISGEPVDSQGRSPNVSIGGSAAFAFGKPSFLERRAYPDEKHYQIADTVSLTKGQHLIKFGFDENRVHDKLDSLPQEGGVYNYPTRADFISDYAALTNGINGGKVCTNPGVFIPCYSSFLQAFGPTVFQFVTWDLAFFLQDDWRVTPRLTINAGLRWDYEILPDPQIPNRPVPATSKFPDDRHDFGPRLGLAWDLTGQGKTVIRAGAGIYYGRIINSTISNAITNTAAPGAQFSITPIVPSAANAATVPLYPNILTAGSPSAGKPDIVFFDARARLPMIYEFDGVLEREIAKNTVVSASYIGSLGHRLPNFIDTNLPAPTTATWTIVGGPLDGQKFTLPAFLGQRPKPNFGRFTTIVTSVISHYNGLVLQFNRRMTDGLQVQSSYTLAKSNDNGQSSAGSGTFTIANNVVNPFDPNLENGPSNFDIRHRFVASAVWQPAYFNDRSRAPRWLLSGYTIAPIVSAASGVPFTGTGGCSPLNTICFVSGNLPSTGAPATPTSTGLLGAGGINRPPFIPRNFYRLPRTSQVDLRISRSFRFHEREQLEFFAEAFNLFNHVNFTAATQTQYTIPSGETFTALTLKYNSTFGTLTNANNGTLSPTQRLLQFGAHFSF